MPTLQDPREELFCREYAKHGNGARAVVAAGYPCKTWVEHGSTSASVLGHNLLKQNKIKERLQYLTEQRARRADVSDVYVLTKLKTVVARCLQEVQPILDPVTNEPTGEYEFDSRGATKGLELIGKYLGMFSDKVTPAPSSGDTYNTQVNIYMPENTRHGLTSHGSQGQGSAVATVGRAQGGASLDLPSNGHAYLG